MSEGAKRPALDGPSPLGPPDQLKIRARNVWQTFLHSRYAPWLTHGSLITLTLSLFALLLWLPLWIAFVPCAIIQHRIGVLLHEYIHGIPLSRYKHNLCVLSFFEGMLLAFGLMHLFRGTHLAHHRWMNTEKDPAFPKTRNEQRKRKVLGVVGVLEGVRHLQLFVESLRGKHPYVIPSWIALGAVQSSLWLAFWVLIGVPQMALKLIALTIYNTQIPISLRGALEHHSHEGDPSFANEYKVLIPLFNLNRHVHHHEDPSCPWYLLEYRTQKPLWTIHYMTHWYHVNIKRDYVLMRPMVRQKRKGGTVPVRPLAP